MIHGSSHSVGLEFPAGLTEWAGSSHCYLYTANGDSHEYTLMASSQYFLFVCLFACLFFLRGKEFLLTVCRVSKCCTHSCGRSKSCASQIFLKLRQGHAPINIFCKGACVRGKTHRLTSGNKGLSFKPLNQQCYSSLPCFPQVRGDSIETYPRACYIKFWNELCFVLALISLGWRLWHSQLSHQLDNHISIVRFGVLAFLLHLCFC